MKLLFIIKKIKYVNLKYVSFNVHCCFYASEARKPSAGARISKGP